MIPKWKLSILYVSPLSPPNCVLSLAQVHHLLSRASPTNENARITNGGPERAKKRNLGEIERGDRAHTEDRDVCLNKCSKRDFFVIE